MLADLNTPLANLDELTELRTLIETYFQELSAASTKSPPPGPNAANGWFRTEIYCLPMAQFAPSGQFSSPDAVQIHNVFYELVKGIHAAFAPENHCANIWTDGTLFVKALDEFKGKLAGVILAVFSALSGDGGNGGNGDDNESKKKQSDVGRALGELIDAIKGSKVKYQGCHMNGWIAGGVHNVGGTCASEAANVAVNDPAAAELRDILKAACGQLAAIQIRRFHPWLDAEWQVAFQAVTQATAAALSMPFKLGAPPPPMQ